MRGCVAAGRCRERFRTGIPSGPRSHNPHFTTGPVPGILVDDVDAATEELRAVDVPIVFGPIRGEGDDDEAWVHFRAPDGNIYEITQGRDLELP